MLMISALVVQMYCVDDFWVGSDSVFINDFLVSSRLYALMISASIVEMCCIDDF